MNALSPRQLAILDAGAAAVLPRLDLGKLAGQRLFMTGATGFFGLWLLTILRALYERGHSVEVCVLSRNPTRFLERHPHFSCQPWLEFLVGNVRDFPLPSRGYDLLLHGATETSRATHAKPGQMLDDIVLGTRRVLELARKSGVRRMLLVSSGAVYGPQLDKLRHQPEDSPHACNPLLISSAYGEGKRIMELLGAIAQREHGIDSVVARCFAFAGPGLPLDGHYAIGNFVRDALRGQAITVQGDGSPMRSYLYGADLAVWLLRLLLEGEAGSAYNVGSDEDLSIKDLALRVRDLLAPELSVSVLRPMPAPPVGRQRYVPDVTGARALGCEVWTQLDDAIRLSADYWRG